jgi:hypothetical protein
MLPVPESLAALLSAFALAFTRPTFEPMQLLVTGTLLTCGQRTVSAALRAVGLGGEGGVELATAHGGEQVRGVILAHADRDGWVGAAELAEGAMGDPPGPTVMAPLHAAASRGGCPSTRTIRKRTIRKEATHSLPLLIYSAQGGLWQALGRGV